MNNRLLILTGIMLTLLAIALIADAQPMPPLVPVSPPRTRLAVIRVPKPFDANAWKQVAVPTRTSFTFDAYNRVTAIRIMLTNLPPTWQLQESTDLKTWSPVTGLTMWDLNKVSPSVTICPTNPIAYYRFKLE